MLGISCPFRFETRSRRPLKNEVNATLSFVHTLMRREVASALEVVGLPCRKISTHIAPWEALVCAGSYGRTPRADVRPLRVDPSPPETALSNSV